MAVSITSDLEIFDTTLIVIFSAPSESDWVVEIETKDAVLFLDNNENLLSINIFNYKNYFSDVEKGFHYFTKDNRKIIEKEFGKQFKKIAFDENILISKVLSKEKHPKNEKLFILEIKNKFGQKTVLTNLANIEVGKNYLMAFEGAFLANGLIIKETKINSVISQGMLVSYRALGIEKDGLVNVKEKLLTENFVEF